MLIILVKLVYFAGRPCISISATYGTRLYAYSCSSDAGACLPFHFVHTNGKQRCASVNSGFSHFILPNTEMLLNGDGKRN